MLSHLSNRLQHRTYRVVGAIWIALPGSKSEQVIAGVIAHMPLAYKLCAASRSFAKCLR